MNAIELPVELLRALLQLGLKTEAGTALLTGYRLGHPVLSNAKGDLQIVDLAASVVVIEVPKDA